MLPFPLLNIYELEEVFLKKMSCKNEGQLNLNFHEMRAS